MANVPEMHREISSPVPFDNDLTKITNPTELIIDRMAQ